MRYSHNSWSIELPPGWQVEESTELVSFFHPDGVGNFEVSTFFSDEGDISLEDIMAFAEAANPVAVNYEYLSGISAQDSEEGESIFEWWLHTGNQMIYATYVCAEGFDTVEALERDNMIRSLRSFHQDIEADE